METVNDTIGGMLEKIAQRYPDRDALIHSEKGTRYTYQLLSWQVDQAVCGLVALGVKRGDHLAIWAANSSAVRPSIVWYRKATAPLMVPMSVCRPSSNCLVQSRICARDLKSAGLTGGSG